MVKAPRSRQSYANPSSSFKITFLDPAVLFLNCYTSLTYRIYYSFFEAFPIVYQGMYRFNLGQMGAAFLTIVVGTIISSVIYNIYIHKVHVPRSRSGNTASKPESVLVPPHALRMFRPIHWLVLIWLGSTAGSPLDRAHTGNRHLPCLRVHPDAVHLSVYPVLLSALCRECLCPYGLYAECVCVWCGRFLAAALLELGGWSWM